MALAICPYQWKYPYNGLHIHKYRTSAQMGRPRWMYGSGPCCELCETYEAIPNLASQLHDLTFFPTGTHHYHVIHQKFETLHHHYRFGLDSDGLNSYLLSRELDKFSKYLNKVSRLYPWFPALCRVANDLRYLGREMQVGPRRRRYYVLPRSRW